MGAPTGIAEQAEQARDLRAQVEELRTRSDRSEIVFIENSPGRTPVTIYSLVDGEPLPIPEYMLDAALSKRQESGQFRFTGDKNKAPEYRLGDVKCFLHPESVERTSGLLAEAGVAGISCSSAHHPSRYAMEEVAKSKHKKQWAALQAFVAERRRQEEHDMQRAQLDATLALAEKAAGVPVAPEPAAAKAGKA